MDIRVFSKYYQYSLKDKVLPIRCIMDSEHPMLVPNLRIDDDGNETIYFYCLDCDSKLYPGLSLYNDVKSILEKLENDEED
jgi:hypothetical protein